jgi:hypothetical protein
MADDLERILKNSLDAVDRGRRWAMLGIVALFVATFFLLLASMHLGPMLDQVLFHALGVLLLFIASCTAVVMLHVTRMTKAILRAIELGRK